MPLLPNKKQALNDLKYRLLQDYAILDFRIFGSKAKGTDTQDSCLDIMIVLEDLSPIIESQINDLIFEVNLKYDSFITALFFGRNELEIGPLSESPIYKKILQEGIAL
jgi:hypothetical protein